MASTKARLLKHHFHVHGFFRHAGQILRVLALEKSSDLGKPALGKAECGRFMKIDPRQAIYGIHMPCEVALLIASKLKPLLAI